MSNARSDARRKTDPERARERERRVVELWLAGVSSEQIAVQLAVTPRSVRRIRERVMVARTAEFDPNLVDQLRELELARIDGVQVGMWQLATVAGDTRAADIVLKCIDRRVRLLGLNAPQRHRVDMKARHELDAEIEQLIEQLEAQGLVTEKADSDPAGELAALRRLDES